MLSVQQTELLNAIFLQSHNHVVENTLGEQQGEGLVIYQQSLVANASKAMAITFATVHSFLGEANFTKLVQQYLIKELRTDYDWGEFGVNFSGFIAQQTVQNSALLSSIAALDFVCHQSERSKNQEQELTSLNLLGLHDAYDLGVVLSAGTFVLTSTFPLDEIVQDMILWSEKNTICTLSDVEKRLTQHSLSNTNNTKQEPFYFVVWRPDFQAQYAQISSVEFNWFTELLKSDQHNHISLGNALDAVLSNTETNTVNGTTGDTECDKLKQPPIQSFSFAEWLPKAIQKQHINRIFVMPSVMSTVTPSNGTVNIQ